MRHTALIIEKLWLTFLAQQSELPPDSEQIIAAMSESLDKFKMKEFEENYKSNVLGAIELSSANLRVRCFTYQLRPDKKGEVIN